MSICEARLDGKSSSFLLSLEKSDLGKLTQKRELGDRSTALGITSCQRHSTPQHARKCPPNFTTRNI